jgi:hypothetical protein
VLVINLQGFENIDVEFFYFRVMRVGFRAFSPVSAAIGWTGLIMVAAFLRAILESMLRLCALGGLFCAECREALSCCGRCCQRWAGQMQIPFDCT